VSSVAFAKTGCVMMKKSTKIDLLRYVDSFMTFQLFRYSDNIKVMFQVPETYFLTFNEGVQWSSAFGTFCVNRLGDDEEKYQDPIWVAHSLWKLKFILNLFNGSISLGNAVDWFHAWMGKPNVFCSR